MNDLYILFILFYLFVCIVGCDNTVLTYSKFDLSLVVNHVRGWSSNEVAFKDKTIEKK